MLLLPWFALIWSWSMFSKVSLKGCTDLTPLGMSNGFIKSSQLLASSHYNNKKVKSQGRLYVQSAWCSQDGDDFKNEWFQVNLTKVTVINGIAIQGDPASRFDYIQKFILKSSNDTKTWHPFGNEFVGNNNNNDISYIWFHQSMIATYVRIYATDIYRNWYDYSCLRLELYGCLDNQEQYQPLGMQLKIISDAQLSSQGEGTRYARLYNRKMGVYRYETGGLYLKIDFKQDITLTAVAMQGHSNQDYGNNGIVQTYNIYASNDSMKFNILNQTFKGNDVYGTDPVLAILSHPITARVFKIERKTFLTRGCCYYMKVELYGKRAVCGNTLHKFTAFPNSSRNPLHTPADAYINSPITWCTNSWDNKYIHVKFKNPVIVGGIVLQGDSRANNWVTKFKVTTSFSKSKQVYYENLKGNIDRIFPLAVHWFSKMSLASDLWINPLDQKNKCCLRFAIKGCTKVMSKPHSLNISQDDRQLLISWQSPEYSPLAITKYLVSISVTKPYNKTFQYYEMNEVDPSIKSTDILLLFGGAMVKTTVKAHIGEYFQKVETTFNFFCQDPPAPVITIDNWFDGFSDCKNISIFPVGDINGPISIYQVIISTKKLAEDSFKTLALYDQKESLRKKMPYFLAATFPASHITANSHRIVIIKEGEEEINSINASLLTIGTYHLYTRAVILAKDISPHFGTSTYFGKSQHVVIERKSLKNPSFKPNGSYEKKIIVDLVEGPQETISYQVVVMKINKTTVVRRSTSSYTVFKSYLDAGYNEPYITAEFNMSMFNKLKTFEIGDDLYYTSQSNTRKRRSIDEPHYKNIPLVANETYAFYQRVILPGGNYYTSPWSQAFIASDRPAPTNAPKVENQSSNTSLIVGIICGLIVIALVVVLFIIIRSELFDDSVEDECFTWRRKSDQQTPQVLDHLPMTCFDEVAENAYSTIKNNESGPKKGIVVESESYYNLPAKPKFSPIPVADFSSFYLQNKDDKNSDIVKQFKSVPLGQIHACEEALRNKAKNRYQNIIAYDHTRVELPPMKNEKSDYINANFIQGYSGKVTYIAAQAPKNETIFDFWRMILDQKPSAVIMLTNLKEGDKPKCAQYWPEKKSENYHGIIVEVTDKQEFADYVIRKMAVTHSEVQHNFFHMHFTSWPDHGCPEFPTMLLNFCHRFRNIVPYDDPSQVVVHCSAGVGRTGTFIVIDAMIKLIKEQQVVDIYNYFENIRQDRYQMIQTADQYLFTYHAIYEVISCGYTGASVTSFPLYLKDLLTKKTSAGKFLMEEEFLRLNSVTPVFPESYYATAVKNNNADKNRTNILPRESALLHTSRYINAVYINGYKAKNALIATQAPFDDTVQDLWQMVLECNVTTIVMLHELNENGSIYPKYWPEDKELKFNNLTVELVTEVELGDISQRRFVVQGKKLKATVNFLHLRNWKNHDIPNTNVIIALIGEVLKSQQAFGNGKILVICSDGASRSGTLIACMNALDQLKVEQHIDVFQTVRRMRLVRPEFVENLRQYQFIYTVLNQYLDSFATYSNFN